METRNSFRIYSGYISVGNQVPRYSGWKRIAFDKNNFLNNLLETKYRDIADGNVSEDAA